jgi:hypothetical protein
MTRLPYSKVLWNKSRGANGVTYYEDMTAEIFEEVPVEQAINTCKEFISGRILNSRPLEPPKQVTLEETINLILSVLLNVGFYGFLICCASELTTGSKQVDTTINFLLGFALLIFLFTAISAPSLRRRATFLDKYEFPSELKKAIIKHYPSLSDEHLLWILEGLRQYLKLRSDGSGSLPSRAIDIAWQEFTLLTSAYTEFCEKGLGKSLGYSPGAKELSEPIDLDMRMLFEEVCHFEGINSSYPSRLPFLFALDLALGIPDGFKHSLEKDYAIKSNEYPWHKVES